MVAKGNVSNKAQHLKEYFQASVTQRTQKRNQAWRKDVSADSLEVGVKPIHSSTQSTFNFAGMRKCPCSSVSLLFFQFTNTQHSVLFRCQTVVVSYHFLYSTVFCELHVQLVRSVDAFLYLPYLPFMIVLSGHNSILIKE